MKTLKIFLLGVVLSVFFLGCNDHGGNQYDDNNGQQDDGEKGQKHDGQSGQKDDG